MEKVRRNGNRRGSADLRELKLMGSATTDEIPSVYGINQWVNRGQYPVLVENRGTKMGQFLKETSRNYVLGRKREIL
jgi:hypothetical protein